MLVAIITEQQKNELLGQELMDSWLFYPVKDCNGNWIISEEEINNCINPQFEYVKTLPLIEWCGHYQ